MEEKELIALILFTVCGILGSVAAALSPRARDAAFFLGVFGLALVERGDVNLFSQWWYRGTTRGIEIWFVDLLLFSALAGCVLSGRRDGLPRVYWPRTLGLMLLYFGYCTFSVITSHPKAFGICELSKVFRGLLVFLCGAYYLRTRRELTVLALALACFAGFEAVSALRQRFMMGMSRVGGTLFHPNSLSMFMCLAAPILVGAATSVRNNLLRTFFWTAIAASGICVALTLSRTGMAVYAVMLIASIVWCCNWNFSWRKVSGVLIGFGVAVVVIAGMWDKLKERYLYSSFAEEYIAVEAGGENRGIYIRWALMMGDEHRFGVGLNNWSYWVSKEYGERLGFRYHDYDENVSEKDHKSGQMTYAPPAHSLLALTLGELGYPGVAIFGLLWLRWMLLGVRYLRHKHADPLSRWGIGMFFGVLGVFLHNITEWNYRQTTIMFALHLALGALAAMHWWRKHVPVEESAEPDEDGIVEGEFTDVASEPPMPSRR